MNALTNSLGTLADKLSVDHVRQSLSKKSFLKFVTYTMPEYQVNWHHRLVAEKLQELYERKIKNLMVLMPPQHGKSELCSIRFPAWILGKDPDRRIAGVSYDETKATDFNTMCRRVIEGEEYQKVFEDTKLRGMVGTSDGGSYSKSMRLMEVVGRKGSYRSVGIGGGLTGNPVDLLIIDDTVKNMADALSRAIQLTNNRWLDSVGRARLDNNGQMLLINTRWCEGDIAGKIKREIREGIGEEFDVIDLPAIKETPPSEFDPRENHTALWEQKHSLERLEKTKKRDPAIFSALYQQNPKTPTELKVFGDMAWEPIDEMPDLPDFYGLDFGFSVSVDALVRIMHKDGFVYLDEIIYKRNLSTAALVNEVKGKVKSNNKIYADSAEPRIIEDMKLAGLNIEKCKKGQGSKLAGIFLMRGLSIRVTKRSKNLWYEKDNYRWVAGPDGRPDKKMEPVDETDHLMDAARYGLHTKIGQHLPVISMGNVYGAR